MAVPYEVDEEVEIIGTEEGLIGSYHLANVVEVLPMAGYYCIEYHLLRLPNGGPFSEIVPGGLLRPHPPFSLRSRFVIGEHVDLWSRDGWWYGTVQSNPQPGRYEINFQAFDYENVVAPATDMRPHYHWNGIDWSVPDADLLHVD